MKKGEIYSCTIMENRFPATGICTIDQEDIAIEGAYIGEEIDFRLGKRRKGIRTGRLQTQRQGPCEQFGLCGGCISQHLSLKKQREIKSMEVKDLFQRRGFYLPSLEIYGPEEAFCYRNKVELNFGNTFKDGPLQLGFYERHMGRNVLPTKQCLLIHEDLRRIRDLVLDYALRMNYDFYHVMRREGFLRHLVLRRSFHTGEIMVNLVTTTQRELDLSFVHELLDLSLEGEIVSILHTENDSLSNFIYADKIHLLHGRMYIREFLLEKEFRISPFSFFQTNTQGAEVLFSRLRSLVGKRKGTLCDLYCGTGTIGLLLSDNAQSILGIEIVEEAVEAARENAKRNNITNATYICDDVKNLAQHLDKKPDLLVVDPPRSGLHPQAIKDILALNLKEIFYVSCNPKTLVRDLEAFKEGGYELKHGELIDLYPHTPHVETIVLMEKIEKK